MKSLLLILFSVLSMAVWAAEPLRICCTTYPIWLLCRQVTAGASNVQTELLIPAGTGCPHDYVITPNDMRKLSRKNILVFRNGLGMDDFILKALKKVNPQASVIAVCDKKAALRMECTCKDHHHEHHGHHEHAHHRHEESEFNPHLFASPDKAAGLVNNMTGELVRRDRANASIYRRNQKELIAELQNLTREMEAIRKQVQGAKVIVQHDIFQYLMDPLGLKIIAELNSEEYSLSAAEMARIAKLIRQHKVQVIFTEPQYPVRTAQTLAKECGIRVCTLDPLASGPRNPPLDLYARTMKENLKKIRSILIK